MKNIKRYLIASGGVLLVLFGVAIATSSKKNTEDGYKRVRFENGKVLRVEIADTFEKTRAGLMFRTELPENDGMLFAFPSEARHNFWMKNTLIPLDMIWVNSSLEVIYIEKSASPCKTINCPSYGPSVPVLYVLEANGGWTDNNGITTGMKLTIN